MSDTKQFAIDVKEVDDDGHFTGLLSVYNVVDQGGDVVEPGAFTKTMLEKGDVVPMLWSHREPIGKLKLKDTPNALEVTGHFTMAVTKAREVHALMKDGVVKGLSIGYRVVKDHMDGNIRRLKELKLYEGSVVLNPMNELAQVTRVKEQELEARITGLENEIKALKATPVTEPAAEPPQQKTNEPDDVHSLASEINKLYYGELQ